MKIFAAATALTVSTVILPGACSAKKDDADSTSTSSSGAGAALADAKMPKPGLREMTVSAEGMPNSMKTQMCVGAPVPGTNPFAPPPQAGADCTKNGFTKTATGYSIDIACKMNGMMMSTKGDVSGDFSSNYKTVMKTKMSGPNIPPAMQTERTSTAEAKYLGACPTGMSPATAKQAG
ncbi:DUF3617 family protein (plasmid) [Polymorphobacter sp. PAMC 29334]|uniref:DUF3617 domain-containing protein n=1 Tax=Polymorphobacter sp. PAMC 29334 TaxID=2862331 RepID=UPI001C7776F0|nr:DUF3617 family protein [Polymorphobacter sp. PAMC 29334]QYE32951.1 DUF3617 family protein [Polymorphobacter sp. PAMC 29334]